MRIKNLSHLNNPLEDTIQKSVFEWEVIVNSKDFFMFSIPNGEKRPKITAKRLKSLGVKSGVSDICVLISRGRTLWIELKRLKGSTQSDTQKAFQAVCERLDHKYFVAKSLDEVVEIINKYK